MLILQQKTGTGTILPTAWDPATAINMTVHSDVSVRASVASSDAIVMTNKFKDSGKWYYEFVFDQVDGSGALTIGLATADADGINSSAPGTSWVYYPLNGKIYVNGSFAETVNTMSSVSDTAGIAYDADNDQVHFYINGVHQSTTTFTGDNKPVSPAAGSDMSNTQHHTGYAIWTAPFNSTVPSGYSGW